MNVINIEELRAIKQLKLDLATAHSNGDTIAALDIAKRLHNLYTALNIEHMLYTIERAS